MSTYDVIVIGAGHNGLVAALELAKAGRSVLVVERAAAVGGAVMSAEVTLPGLEHDLYATNLNLFLGSPTFREHAGDLARLGFEPATSTTPYASAFPGGRALVVHQDAARTLAGLRAHSPADAAGWEELHELHRAFVEHLLPVYGMPLPSSQALVHVLRKARTPGPRALAELARVLVLSTGDLGEEYLETPEARSLVAAWGMHLDFAPDTAGGAMFPLLECFMDMAFGMSIARGGASRLPEALAALAREHGAEIRTQAEVARVELADGRARGVVLADGERLAAREGVVANLAIDVLFGGLVEHEAATSRAVTGYRRGPGTMMVHLALDGPLAWAAGPELTDSAYVHLGPWASDMQRAYALARDGVLPDEPLLVVGQTTRVDPSRVRDGREIVWIQVRCVPSTIRGDVRGELASATWDACKDAYADRVVAKLEAYAPGTRERIVGRAVLSPDDLERANPNLRGGDSLAGSHHLAQNVLFRPAPGWTRYRTPVEGLWMCGAGTWPGAGTNALSGYHVARELVDDARGRSGRLAARVRGLGRRG